jgi:hypothetical protein
MNAEEGVGAVVIVGSELSNGDVVLAFMTNTGILIELRVVTKPTGRQQTRR